MKKRPLGRPNITVRHFLINDMEKNISNVDPVGCFNTWAHIAFDESRWTELVNNLDSTKADWDNSDWKGNEPEENSDWNKSPPSSPPLSRSSSKRSSTPSSSLSNNNISYHIDTLVAISSCLK